MRQPYWNFSVQYRLLYLACSYDLINAYCLYDDDYQSVTCGTLMGEFFCVVGVGKVLLFYLMSWKSNQEI